MRHCRRLAMLSSEDIDDLVYSLFRNQVFKDTLEHILNSAITENGRTQQEVEILLEEARVDYEHLGVEEKELLLRQIADYAVDNTMWGRRR